MTSFAKTTLKKSISKYVDNFIGSNIQFSKDRKKFKCEIDIHVDSSIFIKAAAISDDAYDCFNIANEKIKKRIRRYHKKLTDHRLKKKSVKYLKANEYVIQDPENSRKNLDVDNPVIIAESEEIIKNLSVSEALMFMNLNDQNAIFFKNVKTNRLNILFKRSDGNIGWLDPKK